MKNFIVRTITSVFFVAAIVTCFLSPRAMVLLFALVTGMTIWEFAGLVNDRPSVTITRAKADVSVFRTSSPDSAGASSPLTFSFFRKRLNSSFL